MELTAYTKKNLCKILDILQKNNISTIKKQYKKLSTRYHPDGESPDIKKFESVYVAYYLLKDKEFRKNMDSDTSFPNIEKLVNNAKKEASMLSKLSLNEFKRNHTPKYTLVDFIVDIMDIFY